MTFWCAKDSAIDIKKLLGADAKASNKTRRKSAAVAFYSLLGMV